MLNKLKCRFEWMGIFFSPFITPKPKFYFHKNRVADPRILPIIFAKSKVVPYRIEFRQKKFGIDIMPLGYRRDGCLISFVFNPTWRLIIGNFQITVIWELVPIIWENFLTYEKLTNKNRSKMIRLVDSRELNPSILTDGNVDTDWFLKSLKKKWRVRFI